MRITAALALAVTGGLAVLAPSANAEVVGRTDQAFSVKFTAEVGVNAEDAWSAMIQPSTWWLGEHTYSGDAGNLSLDANAGGCFCERLPAATDHPSEGPRGSVEHMRVIYVEHPRALRLAGALGPLQPEAVMGVLTVTFMPVDGGGTRIMWSYNVSGAMKTEQMAPMIDKILGVQFDALVHKLGPKAVGAAPASPADAPAAGPPKIEAQPVEPRPDAPDKPAEPPPPLQVDPLDSGR